MDPLYKKLMDEYGLTAEQAAKVAKDVGMHMQLYRAASDGVGVEGSMAFQEGLSKGESGARSDQAQRSDEQLRQQRVNFYNDVKARSLAGKKVTPQELDYIQRVDQQAPYKQAAAKMVAQPKYDLDIGPAQMTQPSRYDLELGPAQVAPLPVAQRPSVKPDPTRYELMRPMQAFTEAFHDYSAPPPDIDPASGSPMGSADYYAYREAPVQAANHLSALEQAQQYRAKNAAYWQLPENRARAKQLDDELQAARKGQRK